MVIEVTDLDGDRHTMDVSDVIVRTDNLVMHGFTGKLLLTSSPDADPLPAADEAAGQPTAPTPLPGAAGDRPWYDNPQEIARLWSYLDERDLACHVRRSDIPRFIENAHKWGKYYVQMTETGGPTDG